MDARRFDSRPAYGFRTDAEPTLEAVELEFALQLEDPAEHGFEAAVMAALRRTGGSMLFQLGVDRIDGCRQVAAVSIGEGEERQTALVVLPSDGGPMRVETALEPVDPLAGFARSHAGLMDSLSRL